MFMRYLSLAILASTAVLSQASTPGMSANSNDIARQLADFAWEIEPEDGFPVIAVDDANENSEVVFKYNYTGTLSANKYLDVNLFQNDCSTVADASLAFINTTTGNELDIDLDIIQETISNSVHYQDINPSAAIIEFCLRVDYNYVDGDGLTESINFYETIVTITVDLTANFTLSGVSVARFPADSETADFKLDYPVEAYICLDDNSEVGSPAALEQGSILQVCVKMDDTVISENIVVEDILTFVVSQPSGSATDSKTIANGVADLLTEKVCRASGICNVKTQLLSKFFTENIPGDLQVNGVAILAFGKASLMPSSAPTTTVRRLRAPIRGLLTGDDVKAFMAAQENNNNNKNRDDSGISVDAVVAESSQRMLQDGSALFGLAVGLKGDNGDSGGGSTVVVAAIILTMISAGCGYAGFRYGSNKSHEVESKTMMDHDASVGGTYPSEASLFSYSSSQPGSPRRAMDQHSSNASVGGTYLSDASVFLSSSNRRHGSPRRTRDQHNSDASTGGTYPSEPSVFSSSSTHRHSSPRRARDQHSSNASVSGAYPNEPPVSSSSSSRHSSPRRARDQHNSDASTGGTYPSEPPVFSSSSTHRHGSPRRARDQHSSSTSVGGTYPSQASVNTSSSSRHGSHRPRDQQQGSHRARDHHGSHRARDQHSSNASVGSDSQAPVYASSSSRHGSHRPKNQKKMVFVD
jgi:hypothetical protein